MSSPWLDDLPNSKQGTDERKAKYAVVLMHDCNCYWAQRMRDWRWAKIARRFGFQTVDDLLVATGVEVNFYLDKLELTAVIE